MPQFVSVPTGYSAKTSAKPLTRPQNGALGFMPRQCMPRMKPGPSCISMSNFMSISFTSVGLFSSEFR